MPRSRLKRLFTEVSYYEPGSYFMCLIGMVLAADTVYCGVWLGERYPVAYAVTGMGALLALILSYFVYLSDSSMFVRKLVGMIALFVMAFVLVSLLKPNVMVQNIVNISVVAVEVTGYLLLRKYGVRRVRKRA